MVKEPKTEEAEEKRTLVVTELPTQQSSEGTIQETGEKVDLITIETALTEMYEDIKAIRKAVA